MDITDYGFIPTDPSIDLSTIARVGVENKSNFGLFSNWGEITGVVRGNMLKDPKQLPKVGDWVIIEKLQGERKAVITSVLPRKSILSRSEENGNTQIQVVNVDTMFIVTDVVRDFNPRRLERYIATAKNAGCDFVILLTKSDLVEDVDSYLKQANELGPAIAIANTTGHGLNELLELLKPKRTYVFVGSSGVGKSSLINNLLKTAVQLTNEVSADNKGRHTTTRREMFLLSNGAIVIDTPGIRELGIQEDAEQSFDDVEELVLQCKFSDCDHVHNIGCALLQAVETGALDKSRYTHYLKLRSEALRVKGAKKAFEKRASRSLKQFYNR